MNLRLSFAVCVLFVAVLALPATAQPPATVGTLDLGLSNPDTAGNAHLPDTVSWYEVVHIGGLLTVDTNGSSFDTELGLYDSLVRLITNDDDGGIGTQSLLASILDPGSYFAAASGFNTTFGDTLFDVTPGPAAGDLVITALASPVVPPTTLATFDLTATPMGMATNNADAGTILWYEIIHPGGDLTLTTDDPATTLPDTEVGIWDELGFFIDSNDDIGGGNLLSELLVNEPAGTYYAATGGFNMSFADGFLTSSTDLDVGDIKLKVFIPEPATGLGLLMGSLGLLLIRRK